MNYNKLVFYSLALLTFCFCKTKETKSDLINNIKVVSVNPEHFITENLISDIKKEMVDIEGNNTLCYIIQSNSQASEHQMGPWCPKHIDDNKEKGGIWFKDGKVFDVNGHFIANLATFYNDDKWNLLREDGSIKVTLTKEACEAAAKPNVEEAYKNHCVECLPEYFKHQTITYTIPVTPSYTNKPQKLKRGALGLAFNGVKFDPPAPLHAILAANTIAPLDDSGGHVNPHGGYHYHAATGATKEIKQLDDHSPMIGYAMDGFGIYTHLNKNNEKPMNLDECGGHEDETRGYHYHAGEPGANQVLKCLKGVSGFSKVKE